MSPSMRQNPLHFSCRSVNRSKGPLAHSNTWLNLQRTWERPLSPSTLADTPFWDPPTARPRWKCWNHTMPIEKPSCTVWTIWIPSGSRFPLKTQEVSMFLGFSRSSNMVSQTPSASHWTSAISTFYSRRSGIGSLPCSSASQTGSRSSISMTTMEPTTSIFPQAKGPCLSPLYSEIWLSLPHPFWSWRFGPIRKSDPGTSTSSHGNSPII